MLRALKNSKSLLAAACLAAACFLSPVPAQAGIFISVRIGPPALPIYVPPPCPRPNYFWTPGYWAYGPAGYYWVPGVWVAPPQVGVLWTPGYWGYAGGLYGWHAGYWGPHVGFYGGINYGFGYGGSGFVGGGWSGGVYHYNRTIINNTTIVNNRVAFNGPGGVVAQPSAQERAYEHEQHFQPTQGQFAHEHAASLDRNQFASVNHGRPAYASMDRVGGNRFNEQARAANQQQRIGQGIQRGQLNAGQAAHLEHQEQNINRQVHADREANGGRLTPQEHHQVNREQNRESRRINEDRHEEHPKERR